MASSHSPSEDVPQTEAATGEETQGAHAGLATPGGATQDATPADDLCGSCSTRACNWTVCCFSCACVPCGTCLLCARTLLTITRVQVPKQVRPHPPALRAQLIPSQVPLRNASQACTPLPAWPGSQFHKGYRGGA